MTIKNQTFEREFRQKKKESQLKFKLPPSVSLEDIVEFNRIYMAQVKSYSNPQCFHSEL